jgi:hypothetical protein
MRDISTLDGYGGIAQRLAQVQREIRELTFRLDHSYAIIEFTSDLKTRAMRKMDWVQERNSSLERLNQVRFSHNAAVCLVFS